MCKTILANNSIGCISYCFNQQIFSVAIGNIFINLNAIALSQLKSAIKNSRDELYKRNHSFQRVFLETPLENFFLSFNTEEVNDCLELFFEAEMELSYQNLLIECGIV
ncbi:MAG: hypothetical protein RLZZ414_722 [Bacteroidota bacterium]|jgi:hypothetical protein